MSGVRLFRASYTWAGKRAAMQSVSLLRLNSLLLAWNRNHLGPSFAYINSLPSTKENKQQTPNPNQKKTTLPRRIICFRICLMAHCSGYQSASERERWKEEGIQWTIEREKLDSLHGIYKWFNSKVISLLFVPVSCHRSLLRSSLTFAKSTWHLETFTRQIHLWLFLPAVLLIQHLLVLFHLLTDWDSEVATVRFTCFAKF